jgi:hypothetical protein
LTTERPTSTDVRAVEPKERECIAEKHAPRSTVTFSNAVPSAITEEFAGKTRRGLKHVTSDKRWYVQQKRMGGGADPTPMMRNVKVFPLDGGNPFTFEMCPDTGCTMTLISEDVAARQGLTVDTRSQKKVRAVNGQRLNNSGTVTFGIEYQGRTTEVEALVSSSIEGEVLLSWQVLQQLGVINNFFPNVEIKAAVVSTTAQSTDICNERDAKSKLTKMIKEFDRVFNEDGPLRTMKGSR